MPCLVKYGVQQHPIASLKRLRSASFAFVGTFERHEDEKRDAGCGPLRWLTLAVFLCDSLAAMHERSFAEWNFQGMSFSAKREMRI